MSRTCRTEQKIRAFPLSGEFAKTLPRRVERIKQYLERFNENFPLYSLMCVEESKVEAIIRAAEKGPLIGHPN